MLHFLDPLESCASDQQKEMVTTLGATDFFLNVIQRIRVINRKADQDDVRVWITEWTESVIDV
jgi:hypothetical protein